MTMNELFSNGATGSAPMSANQLEKTAELTTRAGLIVADIMKVLSASPELYQKDVEASKTSHDSMDKLIASIHDFSTDNLDFLNEVSETDFEKMLRSQQSKRSRAKAKTMTMENYTSMMIGAVAEQLLRIASGKPKGTVGNYNTDMTMLSEEDIEKLKSNPEALKKAIRNVQSKKSIFKSKASFSEDSDKWRQLLEEEATLKALRDTMPTSRLVDTVRNDLIEALGGVDITTLKASEAKDLLTKITGIAGIESTEERTGAEQ